MKNQKVLYILIGAFCLFALIAGIYAEFFVSDANKENIIIPNINPSNEEKEKTQDEVKNQFLSLFNNTFLSNGYDETNMIKSKADKELIYEAYNIQKQNENFEVDIHLPVINIKGEVPKEFNTITQRIFADKASEILGNKLENKIIYTVNYMAYINEDILSLVIKSTLKDGSNPQRVIVQTYNYNLLTGEKVELADILAKKNIIQSECKEKINKIVGKAQEEAQILVQSGYAVYNRDLTNKIYEIENISTYFLGENSELYIIFAYGNQNFTSEMDVILYE